ncbi:hypothetical protein [Brotaphodocola sp.]|uniref:hypothetical protein n=1 Tax=Brotaphodocola sp. TaxID=3073577 RepID=UPI003D7E3C64
MMDGFNILFFALKMGCFWEKEAFDFEKQRGYNDNELHKKKLKKFAKKEVPEFCGTEERDYEHQCRAGRILHLLGNREESLSKYHFILPPGSAPDAGVSGERGDLGSHEGDKDKS